MARRRARVSGAGEMRLTLSLRGTAWVIAAAAVCVLAVPVAARAGAVEDAIAARIDAIAEGRVASIGGVTLSGAEFVAELYRLRGFWPVWSTPLARAELLAEVSDARRHGFRPEDFATEALERLAEAVGAGDPAVVAAFDGLGDGVRAQGS